VVLSKKNIEIENFRLLKNFSIDLEKDLSLILWKNNCWKTSFLSILDNFLNWKNFSFNDICFDEKEKIESILKTNIDLNLYYPLWIHMRIIIEYSEWDNLSNLPILNLSPTKNEIILDFQYIIIAWKILLLQKDFEEYCKNYEEDFWRFIKKNWNKYFERKIFAVDVDDENNYKEIPENETKKIINLEIISAKRSVENKSWNNTLSDLAYKYFEKSSDVWKASRVKLQKALIDADKELDWAYDVTFEKITESIKKLSINTTELNIESNLDELNILKDNTSVTYKDWKGSLPESYNGLGYMNFFAIIFYIHIICDSFKKKFINEKQSDINILFIEEPEAHTHPQMQYVFIQKIKELLEEEKNESWFKLENLQTIITTHSAHIASKSDFNDVKYFYKLEEEKNIDVRNLSELESKYWTTDEWTRNFKFLKKYLTIHKSELFFADKVIFIEWDTERLLIPAMMKKIDKEKEWDSNFNPLLSQNISIVDVWANSKTFEHFIDFLWIKTLIITDIDSIWDDRKKCKVDIWTDTSNNSIKFFLEWKSFIEIKELKEEWKQLIKENNNWKANQGGLLYIIYQISENWYNARSFEDSFISLNLSFIKTNKDNFKDSIKNKNILDENPSNFYKIAEECIKSKTWFATDILFYSDENYSTWEIPDYIRKWLLWL